MKEVFLTLLWVIFIADSLLLVLIVLIQSGRGGGLSGMLGGGGMSESALGPKSGLPRITGVMATIFFVAAILISILTRPRQAMDPRQPKEAATKVDETPAAKPDAEPAGKAGEPKKADTPKPPAEPKATKAVPPAKATTSTTPAPQAGPTTPTTPEKTK